MQLGNVIKLSENGCTEERKSQRNGRYEIVRGEEVENEGGGFGIAVEVEEDVT